MADTIKYEKGEDGIVVLTLDDPNQGANTMNADYIASMGATVDRLEAEKDDIKGVVLTSGKSTFFAGGDLNDLLAWSRASCAAWRRSASPSPPPSTARRSAGAWRSAWPRTTA